MFTEYLEDVRNVSLPMNVTIISKIRYRLPPESCVLTTFFCST